MGAVQGGVDRLVLIRVVEGKAPGKELLPHRLTGEQEDQAFGIDLLKLLQRRHDPQRGLDIGGKRVGSCMEPEGAVAEAQVRPGSLPPEALEARHRYVPAGRFCDFGEVARGLFVAGGTQAAVRITAESAQVLLSQL